MIVNSARHPWVCTNETTPSMSIPICCKSAGSPHRTKRQNPLEGSDLQSNAAALGGDCEQAQQLQHEIAGHRRNCQFRNSESYRGRQSPRGAASKSAAAWAERPGSMVTALSL